MNAADARKPLCDPAGDGNLIASVWPAICVRRNHTTRANALSVPASNSGLKALARTALDPFMVISALTASPQHILPRFQSHWWRSRGIPNLCGRSGGSGATAATGGDTVDEGEPFVGDIIKMSEDEMGEWTPADGRPKNDDAGDEAPMPAEPNRQQVPTTVRCRIRRAMRGLGPGRAFPFTAPMVRARSVQPMAAPFTISMSAASISTPYTAALMARVRSGPMSSRIRCPVVELCRSARAAIPPSWRKDCKRCSAPTFRRVLSVRDDRA
jgi:hypothetical protein